MYTVFASAGLCPLMKRLAPPWLSLLLMGGLLGIGTPAHAQEFGRVEKTESNVNAYYYHVQPGNATVQAHVLGDVRAPGYYEINQGTNLGDLLALSGGPYSNSRQYLTRRTVTIRLYRYQSPSRALIYEKEFGRSITDAESYPVLEDGDVLSVEITERRRFSWRDGFTIVNTMALLALTAERLTRIN